ncbi:MAG TPA: hypothetical protein VFA56_01610 [Gaiellaceae bacterium]|nr:hypothetical protein [Gaiellaceae bacterium]
MTHDFDELVGPVETTGERSRLERAHDLLVQAGPPPELPPQLAAGPTLAMTLGRVRSRRHLQRRVGLLAAAVIVLLIAFLAGYISGNDSTVSGRLLKLQGTAAAPAAQASLRIDHVDAAGNWPMQFAALGLPKTKGDDYYEVFLLRRGGRYLPCGSFVARGPKVGVNVRLNAPYRIEKGDVWVVTLQKPGDRAVGPVVLKPVT